MPSSPVSELKNERAGSMEDSLFGICAPPGTGPAMCEYFAFDVKEFKAQPGPNRWLFP